MAQGSTYPVLVIPKLAQAEITALRFVKTGSSGAEYIDVCGANERALGVALGSPGETFAIGKAVDVMVMGIATVQAHDASAAALGDPIESGAVGRAIKCATDKHLMLGISVGAVAGAQDDLLQVLLAPSLSSL